MGLEFLSMTLRRVHGQDVRHSMGGCHENY